MIAVVYYVYCVGNWKAVVTEQLNRLRISELYDSADALYLIATDSAKLNREALSACIENHPKIKLEYGTENSYEYPGIKKVYDIGKENKDAKILYFHAKGVSNTYKSLSTGEQSAEKVKNILAWRKCLEYFMIDKWRECIDKLNEFDNVGVSCTNGWFYGNFWWTKSSHIEKTQPPIKTSRWYYEAWLNTGVSAKNYEFYHFDFSTYLCPIREFFYIKTKDKRDLEFIAAEYGTSDIQIDEGRADNVPVVLADVSAVVRNNFDKCLKRGFDIDVNNSTLGIDPIFGQKKFLFIHCKYGDDSFDLVVEEYAHLRFVL
jgi:hypothetical protein